MLQFHAVAVVISEPTDEEYPSRTVQFDAQHQEHFLYLEEIPECHSELAWARVYTEVDALGTAGGDSFESADLGRSHFRIAFTDKGLAELRCRQEQLAEVFTPVAQLHRGVLVTFELDDQRYGELCTALRAVFKGVDAFRIRSEDAEASATPDRDGE
jgi:hypothetical protein